MNGCAVKKNISLTCSDPTQIPTIYGIFTAISYSVPETGISHLVLIKGNITRKEGVLVRVHSECVTGDVFTSKRCDCGMQLKEALKKIQEEEEGVIIYLRDHEGRGIGLSNKISAYHLQDTGFDTVEANELLGFPDDARDYQVAADILRDLAVSSIRLLTNNPRKRDSLAHHGVKIQQLLPLSLHVTEKNRAYLKTKQTKMGHLIDI